MGLSGIVTELARLGAESFGLAGKRAETERKALEKKRKDLEEKQEATDGEFAALDKKIALDEAAQDTWSGDFLGFMLGNSDAFNKVRLQALAHRGEAIDAELELVRRDAAAAGRGLAKFAKQAGSLEKSLRGANEAEGDATQKDARMGAVAENVAVEQVSVQQDVAASEQEATAGKMRDRMRVGVERHLTSAADAKERVTGLKRFARLQTHVMRTVFGGLFSFAGQCLRSLGAPPELALVLLPKVVGTALGVAIDGVQRKINDSSADGSQLQAERIQNAKTQLESAEERTSKIAERFAKTHEATRDLVNQVQTSSRRSRGLA